ncbi:MAG: MarR family transcriptional regulator [Clostridium sp.]|jgi:DNA-binding MarR family transcriptional regulator|nr:MarR family transcriptional regulator [Clostridium sp.]
MTKLSKIDASLMVGISRTAKYLQHQVSLLCSRYDLTQTQFAILEILNTKGELLVGEIQKLILSTPGNVPYVINNLIKKGYVTKANEEPDKRRSRISLTSLGKQKILEILPAHDDLLTEKFDVLSETEKKDLLKLILSFRDGLEEK